MTTIPHVIAGAAAGSLVGNPYLASALGFISHFVLDFIPHWDPIGGKHSKGEFRRKRLLYISLLTIDLGVSVGMLAFLWQYPNLFLGAFFGILPDIDNNLKSISKKFPLLSSIGIHIHEEDSGFHNKTNFKTAVFTQGVVCIIGLIILYARTS